MRSGPVPTATARSYTNTCGSIARSVLAVCEKNVAPPANDSTTGSSEIARAGKAANTEAAKPIVRAAHACAAARRNPIPIIEITPRFGRMHTLTADIAFRHCANAAAAAYRQAPAYITYHVATKISV